ncbi:MAG: hypothetical protein P1U40_03460 [Coxiellaceae bacterium]|nr:hypothetical protein [Coxiellaceae bacterium]
MQHSHQQKQDLIKSEFIIMASHANDKINAEWLGSPMNYFLLEAYIDLCAPDLITKHVSPLNGHSNHKHDHS